MHQRNFEAERGALQCRHCRGRGELVTRLNPANNGLEVICPSCDRWDPLNIGSYLSRRHAKEPTMPVMSFGKFKGQELRNVPTGALDHYLKWEGLYDDQRQAIVAELAARADRKADTRAKTPPPGSTVHHVPEAVRRCAVDLIAVAEQGLLTQHPALKETVAEASGLLRAALQMRSAATPASEHATPI
jgi:hypothetical protein